MTAQPSPLDRLRIARENPADAAAAEALVLAAFGPGRFAKTAERLRERATMAAGFVARQDGRVVGSVRLWAITIDGQAALFLGPIAVAETVRNSGLGADLVGACIAEAQQRGVAGLLLVGDPPYFSRFGFEIAANARLPGPADPSRILWLPITIARPSGMARPA